MSGLRKRLTPDISGERPHKMHESGAAARVRCNELCFAVRSGSFKRYRHAALIEGDDEILKEIVPDKPFKWRFI